MEVSLGLFDHNGPGGLLHQPTQHVELRTWFGALPDFGGAMSGRFAVAQRSVVHA